MTRWFEFEVKWGFEGAAFGAVLGAAICWQAGAPWSYWVAAQLLLALIFGLIGGFLGERIVDRVLGPLISR